MTSLERPAPLHAVSEDNLIQKVEGKAPGGEKT
jgi:hypothetical protein